MLKPQYERRAHRCGWKDGLIEVDLMLTLAQRDYSTLGMWYSRLTDYVVGKSIVPGLDFELKGGRCDLKRNLGLSCFYGAIKRKMERLGTLVIHPITPPWVNLKNYKGIYFK